MTKAHSGGSRGRKAKTAAYSDHADRDADAVTSSSKMLLPAVPMPSPELCLLNSRSPSCLYGANHERSHRRRVHRSLQCSTADTSTIETQLDDGNSDSDGGAGSLDVDELREELRTYEALLSYIGVRLANKRNALEILGIDMGSLTKGFGLLTRNATHGMPFLPIETLVKTLHLRLGSSAIKGIKTPVDLSGHLEEVDSLKDDLVELIGHLVTLSKSDKGLKSKESKATAAAGEDNRRPLTFQDIAHLPLMDNRALSFLLPSCVVAPDDRATVRSLFSRVKGGGDGDPVRMQGNRNKNNSDGDGTSESDVNGCSKDETLEKDDKMDMTTGSLGRGKMGLKHDRRHQHHHQQGQQGQSSSNKCPRTKDVTSTHAKSRVQDLTDYDKDTTSHEDSDDTGSNDGKGGSGSEDDRGRRHHDDVESSSSPSSSTMSSDTIDESRLTEKQMLQNLMDGKLCDGSEPMEPRDLVISILVAGLYEYLPVEFFNELLQDERLSKCFDHIQEPRDVAGEVDEEEGEDED